MRMYRIGIEEVNLKKKALGSTRVVLKTSKMLVIINLSKRRVTIK